VKEEEKPVDSNAKSYGSFFVKASSNSMSASKRTYHEKDIFDICGSRELRLYGQKGKHERLNKFDKGELNYVEPKRLLQKKEVVSGSDSKNEKRKAARRSEMKQMEKKRKRESANSSSSLDSSSSEGPTQSNSKSTQPKKSKKSKSRDSESDDVSSAVERPRKKKKLKK
jgi:hypothetical protein